MPQDFVEIFKGSPTIALLVVNALEERGITPVVKDPSASAKLAGFGIMTNEQSLWVHQDEQHQAILALNTLDL